MGFLVQNCPIEIFQASSRLLILIRSSAFFTNSGSGHINHEEYGERQPLCKVMYAQFAEISHVFGSGLFCIRSALITEISSTCAVNISGVKVMLWSCTNAVKRS